MRLPTLSKYTAWSNAEGVFHADCNQNNEERNDKAVEHGSGTGLAQLGEVGVESDCSKSSDHKKLADRFQNGCGESRDQTDAAKK